MCRASARWRVACRSRRARRASMRVERVGVCRARARARRARATHSRSRLTCSSWKSAARLCLMTSLIDFCASAARSPPRPPLPGGGPRLRPAPKSMTSRSSVKCGSCVTSPSMMRSASWPYLAGGRRRRKGGGGTRVACAWAAARARARARGAERRGGWPRDGKTRCCGVSTSISNGMRCHCEGAHVLRRTSRHQIHAAAMQHVRIHIYTDQKERCVGEGPDPRRSISKRRTRDRGGAHAVRRVGAELAALAQLSDVLHDLVLALARHLRRSRARPAARLG